MTVWLRSRFCDSRFVARCWLVLLSLFTGFNLRPGETVHAVDFESEIAPILAQHCVRCHYDGNAKGDVSLTTGHDLSESGYIDTKDPSASYLVELIHSESGDPPEMPKDAEPLGAEDVEKIKNWIAEGAKWPDGFQLREATRADSNWWSLQEIASSFRFDSIDGFVTEELSQNGLAMNPPADRRTLIRRATYDLTGLPPSPEDVESFVADERPDAYEKLIDRLLNSPHYGERWGRHWLDVVRFGESNGFERNVIINDLWPFRDYVIESLNRDKPFDQFIREHIAGDVLTDANFETTVGSAFLVAGPYDDVGNQDAVQARQIRANTLDEMIRSTSEAFLGLTVGCARCHDHKFDPILQEDYYSLYSTFSAVRHGATTVGSAEEKAKRNAQLQPLEERKRKVLAAIGSVEQSVRQRAKHYRKSYLELWDRPAVDRSGTEETFPTVTAKWVRLVCEARDTALRSRTGFGIDEFEVWSHPQGDRPSVNVALASRGGKASGASRRIEDFPDAYAASLAIDGEYGARFLAASDTLTIELAEPTEIDRVFFSSAKNADNVGQGGFFSFVAEYRIEVSVDGKEWVEVANGRDRKPTKFASNPTHEDHRLFELEIVDFERQRLAQLRKELREIEHEIARVPPLPRVWVGSRSDNEAKGPFYVFLGGSPEKHGNEIVPRSLQILDDESKDGKTNDDSNDQEPPSSSSQYRLSPESTEAERRIALANWIVGSKNPLTPRVLANRVWHYHFGTGIVNTPSDFGYMGGRPTHPELLDFLARKLQEFGWRLKPLHRLIMTSQTYRQASTYRSDAARTDGDARLLWRFPPRRLSAEEIRDTILLLAGQIQVEETLPAPSSSDQTADSEENPYLPDGGPGFRLYRFMQDNVCTYVPLDKHGPDTYRRAVYHQNARASVVDLMTDFDQPDCAFSTPRRASTITPLQSLTMMNHSFTLDMADDIANRIEAELSEADASVEDSKPDDAASVDRQIQAAFQICYQRKPAQAELEDCRQVVQAHGLNTLCRVLLNTSELIYVQ